MKISKKYFITTFGCQANYSDSERIAGVLEKAGLQKAENERKADVLIFNSCSVRQSAEDRIFGLNKKLRRLKMKNCKLKIVITGCMLRYEKRELKKRLPVFDIFLPIRDLKNLPDLLDLSSRRNRQIAKSCFHNQDAKTDSLNARDDRQVAKEYLSFAPKYESKFRVYVPISAGCNNFCSYCVVPSSRGKEYNRPAREIISEVKSLVKKGYKEIWLLGQNVNSWRFNLKNKNEKIKTAIKNFKTAKNKNLIDFADLLKAVNAFPGDFWLRFTSPHPKDFSDDLIKAMAECDKFPKYINLPVQSGDNALLKKMRRPYTSEQYINLVNKIRKAMPDIAISTDIIVGFPGETKKQFQNTADLLKKIKFDMAYISEYSERPGTLAAKKFKDNISKKEKARRKKELTKILATTALENNKKIIGKTINILVDEEKNGRYFGRTASNKVVELRRKSNSQRWKSDSLIGEFAKAKIIKAEPWKLIGQIK